MKRLLEDITDLYSQVVEAKTKLKYSDLILGKLKEIYELKKLSYDKGELSYEELLKTSAEIESALKEQTNMKRELNVYISNLSWLTGKKLSHEHNFNSGGVFQHQFNYFLVGYCFCKKETRFKKQGKKRKNRYFKIDKSRS